MNSVGVASTLGLKTKFVSCDHTNSIVDNDTKVKKVQKILLVLNLLTRLLLSLKKIVEIILENTVSLKIRLLIFTIGKKMFFLM